MPIEHLTYAQIAERLSVSTEAARAIVKRHRVPRSRSNDGKTLAAIDLQEIRHKPLSASSPRGHRSVTDVVVTLKARVAELEAELGRAEERSRGHRADFERERERADHMVTIQDRLIAELENLRSLLDNSCGPQMGGNGLIVSFGEVMPMRRGRLQRQSRRAFWASAVPEVSTSELAGWCWARQTLIEKRAPSRWQRESMIRAARSIGAVRTRRIGREWLWRLPDAVAPQALSRA